MSHGVNAHHSALKLERALGLTSLSNASFCSSPTGDVFYAAGCFVVRYNPEENKQKGFYKATKAVSSIAVSADGAYVAIGERGQSPLITVWSVERYEIISTLAHHKHGVSCLSFSPDGRYLVSVGFKLDRQLLLWDWRANSVLASHKLGNRVHSVSFHGSGRYFVTAGDRHLKWWAITEVLEGESIALEGKAASILEDMRNSVFLDVVCGQGRTSPLVYSTTSTGVLCLFNSEKMVEKWVQLESASSYCLELIPGDGVAGLLLVGCANGIVRCFDPLTLQYVATLPLPSPVVGALPKRAHTAEEVDELHHLPTRATYAACYAVCKVPSSRAGGGPRLATLYGDRSLFVWSIADIYAIAKYRSFQYHRSCIWDLQFVDAVDASAGSDGRTAVLPRGTFVTCSADNTVRFWNTDPRLQRESRHRSPYSREMLHCIDLLTEVPALHHDAQNTSISTVDTRPHHDKGHEPPLNSSISVMHFLQHGHHSGDLDVCEGIPDFEMPDKPQSQYSPRALAVHPHGHEIACGDKMGTVLIFDIRGMRQVSSTPAHSAEVLSLSYSPAMVGDADGNWSLKDATTPSAGHQEAVLLASAGRDRLIHIYNASEGYSPIQTLDHHTSSVTIAKFTSDGRRLLSCGGDRTIAFSGVNGPSVKYVRSITTPHGSINGLAVEASNKFAVSSGQDKRLNIWNLERCKHMRAYRSEHVHAELYKSDIDPSGTYVATCAFDKTISVFDFFSGEMVTQVSGHSELVTGVKFSPDGRHLVSIGGDGCIFMWRVADSLVKAMQDRLMELMSNAQRRDVKAAAAVRKSLVGGAQAHMESPPPLPTPSFGVPEPSQPQTKAVPPIPSSPAVASTDSANRASGSGVPRSRWAERVQQEHGYELFGRKIDPTAADQNRNKFTLELTGTTRAELSLATPSSATKANKTAATAQEPVSTEESAVSGVGLGASTRIGDALEAADDVMQSALSDVDTDDEGDGSELFKPTNKDSDTEAEDEYMSDFETPTGDSLPTRGTEGAKDAAEEADKPAEDFDKWLEEMIRNEVKLAPVVPAAEPTAPAVADEPTESPSELPSKVRNRRVINTATGEVSSRPVAVDSHLDGADPLDKSLSSAFFHNLRRKPSVSDASDQAHHRGRADSNPSVASAASAESPAQAMERRKRETAAALAQMQGRLRVMGILDATKRVDEESEDAVQSPPPVATASAPRSPQSKAETVVSTPVKGDENGYDTASTASEPDGDGSQLDQSSLIVNEIAQKASEYRRILRELEAAKRKAAASFQELSQMRHSLDTSMRESVSRRSTHRPAQHQHHNHHRAPSTASIPENDVLDESMAQVDELLMQFQDSLQGLGGASLTPGGRRGTGAGATAASSTAGSLGLGLSRSTAGDSPHLDMDGTAVSGIDMNLFLERYSDKLADMVGEKLLSKLSTPR